MIYALNYKIVYLLMFVGMSIWMLLGIYFKQRENIWKILNTLLFLVAVYIIFKFTVFHRMLSENHQFMLFAPYSDEFYREMLMNAFLFYPFGLTLTVLIGLKSIVVAFILSFGIESWQYIAGTGVAQGTDVLMNTLGCLIGTVPYFIRFLWRKCKK